MSQLPLSEFADRMNEIMPTIIKEFTQRQLKELYKGKISLPQFLVLDFLSKNGESKMTDIAHFMSVSTPAMTGIVGRLVNSGYVFRIPQLQDRRMIKIKITGRGLDLVRKANQQRREMIMKIFGKISEAERQDYLRILLHLHDILRKEKEERKQNE